MARRAPVSTLTREQRDGFARDGFVIARDLFDRAEIDRVLADVRAVFEDQARKLGRLPADYDDLDVLIRAVMIPGTPERSFIYEFSRHVRSIKLLEGSPVLQGALEDLGLRLPICLEFPTIRYDFPEESQFLTPAHQDVRSIRSARCITVWIPLRRVDAHHGTVAVWPGTHSLGLVEHLLDEKHVKVPDDALSGDAVPVEADAGDVVFMNSFVIHRSHPNASDRIKLNVQAFYNDALAVTIGDEHQALAAIPDYKDL